jgi:hypothetical protein
MRIHTDKITTIDVYRAVIGMHGVSVDVTEHGSHSRARSFDVSLTGTSGRRTNTGRYGAPVDDDTFAATWDEWGIFLAYLFSVDPNAWAGGTRKRPIYDGREDFHSATGGRFRSLKQEDQHKNHRWQRVSEGITLCAQEGCSASQHVAVEVRR